MGCGSLIGVDDFTEETPRTWSVEADGDSGGEGGEGGAPSEGAAGGSTTTPAFGWGRVVGGPEDDVVQVASSVGDHWFAGYIHGKVDFGAGPIGASGRQLFIAAVDDGGALRFARASSQAGGLRVDLADLARHDQGAVLAGSTGEPLLLDGVSLPPTMGTDGLVLFVDEGGVAQTAVQLGGAGTQLALGAAAAADGSSVVVGTFNDELLVGGTTTSSAGAGDAFVAAFDASGALRWLRTLGDAADQRATAVARDAAGWVVAGTYAGTMGADGVTITSAGPGDGFVARFDDAGTLQVARSFATGGQVRPHRVASAAKGVWVGGTFQGTTTLGATEASTTAAPHDWDAFAVRLDASLQAGDAQIFGDETGAEAVLALEATDGFLLAAGEFSASKLMLGADTFECAGGTDAFAFLFGGQGQTELALTFGRNDIDRMVGASLRASSLVGIGTIGSSVAIDDAILQGAGGSDIVLFAVAR